MPNICEKAQKYIRFGVFWSKYCTDGLTVGTNALMIRTDGGTVSTNAHIIRTDSGTVGANALIIRTVYRVIRAVFMMKKPKYINVFTPAVGVFYQQHS